MKTRGIWTLPNALTLSRLPLAALVWIDPLNPALVLPLMALAGLTDMADGWLERRARKRLGIPDEVRTAGAWLDPLCDKTFVISVMAAILVARRPPLWIPALIAAREILQLPQIALYLLWPGLRARLRYDFSAAALGKAVTLLQFLAVGALLVGHPSLEPLAAACGAIGTAAAGFYFRRALRSSRPERTGGHQ
jgi:phosphatidylglycerophosphate synthase